VKLAATETGDSIMVFLTPCESCNRHVKTSDRACPFCGASVTVTMRGRLPRVPKERLGRAAMVVFSATVATGTAGCAMGDETRDNSQPATNAPPPRGSTTTGDQEPSASASATGTMGMIPPGPGNPMGTATTPMQGDPTAVPVYGVPIIPPNPGTMEPPPMGQGGAGMEPEPMMEPEPSMADPMLEPDIGGGGGPNQAADAGADDAGVADAAAAEPEAMLEPEPNAVALYGVTPLPSQ
jgi:hypothetical protein